MLNRIKFLEKYLLNNIIIKKTSRTLKNMTASLIFPDFSDNSYIDNKYYSKFLFKEIYIPENIDETGNTILSAEIDNRTYPLINRINDNYYFFFEPVECLKHILFEKYVRWNKPVTARLPFHYHNIPDPLKIYLYKLLTKLKKIFITPPSFPGFLLDFSVDNLINFFIKILNVKGIIYNYNNWPDNKKYCFILSHDIDMYSAYKNVPDFMNIHNSLGIDAVYFFPSNYYKFDDAVMKQLISGNNEIGIHGYNHSNKLIFNSDYKLKSFFEQMQGYIKKYDVKTFRSPSLLRNSKLFNCLKKFNLIDSSVPSSEYYGSGSFFSGCSSVFPFYLENGLLEIPLTLPLDAQLIALNYSPDEIYNIWETCIFNIKQVGGMVNFAVHLNKGFSYNKKMLETYKKILKLINNDDEVYITTYKKLNRYLSKIN